MPDHDLFPSELKAVPHWCVYRLVPDPKREGKFKKPPFQSKNPQYGASSVDPRDWSTYEEAVAAWKNPENKLDGVGFFFTPPYFGFDLDDCRDPESGATEEWAEKFLTRWATYAELSPSKRGYHGIGRGRVPLVPDPKVPTLKKPTQSKAGRAEAYGSERYFTVTGWALEGCEEVREFTDAEVADLFREVLTLDPRHQKAETSQRSSSSQLSYRQRINELQHGRWQPLHSSQSEADLEYCCYLASCHDGNADRVLEDFKSSKLYRGPELKQPNYPRQTAEAACLRWANDPNRGKRKDEQEVIDPDSWPSMFDSYEQFESSPPLTWVIQGLAEEGSINMIGGLSGHGKTWIKLAITRSLLSGEKLFQNFEPHPSSNGVMYLIPEVGRRNFWKRIKLFHLEEFVKDQTLIIRTLSMGTTPKLSDPRILKAAEGRDVFLDTAIRFMDGDENSASDNQQGLAQDLFNLQNAGARTIWGAHHSPKSFEKDNYMKAENVLRGSGDIIAMLFNAYGIKQLDAQRNLIHVECIKGRDLDEVPKPFQIEGRPWIDKEGRFHMVNPPGRCGDLLAEVEKLGLSPGQKGKKKQVETQISEEEAGRFF